VCASQPRKILAVQEVLMPLIDVVLEAKRCNLLKLQGGLMFPTRQQRLCFDDVSNILNPATQSLFQIFHLRWFKGANASFFSSHLHRLLIFTSKEAQSSSILYPCPYKHFSIRKCTFRPLFLLRPA
jgi:hypothetical protein